MTPAGRRLERALALHNEATDIRQRLNDLIAELHRELRDARDAVERDEAAEHAARQTVAT